MEEDYKEFKIEYRDFSNVWRIINKEGEEVSDKNSLTEAKKFIDDMLKKKFDRRKIIKEDDKKIVSGEITSIIDGRCWLSWTSGYCKREKKFRSDDIILDTPENRELMGKKIELTKQIEAVEKKYSMFVCPKRAEG